MFIVQRMNILVQFTDLCVQCSASQVGVGGYWQFSCRIFYAQKLECVLKDWYRYRQCIAFLCKVEKGRILEKQAGKMILWQTMSEVYSKV